MRPFSRVNGCKFYYLYLIMKLFSIVFAVIYSVCFFTKAYLMHSLKKEQEDLRYLQSLVQQTKKEENVQSLPTTNPNKDRKLDVTEAILARITSHGRIRYRLGCDGRPPCAKNGFDCSGLVSDARRHVNYYTGRKLNGESMFVAGFKISYKDAQRGDYILFEPYQEGKPNHFAIISRGWSGWTLEILDTFTHKNLVTPRVVKIINGTYAGKFKIKTMRLDYDYTVAINKLWKPYRYKK